MNKGRIGSESMTSGTGSGGDTSAKLEIKKDASQEISPSWKDGIFPEEYMYPRLREEISRAGRYRHYLSLMMIDLPVHTTSLPGSGNDLSEKCIRQIRSLLRSTDIVFTLDSGKISVILPETTERESQYVIERLRGDIETTAPIYFGVASYPHDAGHEVSLVEHANERLIHSLSDPGL